MVPKRGSNGPGSTASFGEPLVVMDSSAATVGTVREPWLTAGNLCAEVRETHTGVVTLMGDKAVKAKKPLVTDFLDFSTVERRADACRREVLLNRRLAPASYVGVGHFNAPQGGPAEPIIVMPRYADSTRLTALVGNGASVDEQPSPSDSRTPHCRRPRDLLSEDIFCLATDGPSASMASNLPRLRTTDVAFRPVSRAADWPTSVTAPRTSAAPSPSRLCRPAGPG